MIPRLLLAFGIVSALVSTGIAILKPATDGHQIINTAQYQNCDPVHDPQRCPKLAPVIDNQV